MAIDFNNPVKTQNYDTGVLQSIRDHISGLALWLESGAVSVTNQPNGAKRYNATLALFEYWNGTSWAELPVKYLKKTGDVASGLINFAGGVTGNNGIATATASLGECMVQGSGTGAAMMAFHRPGYYASYFGLDTDNNWAVGGWSAGAVRNRIWHEGNLAFSTPVGNGSVAHSGTLEGVWGGFQLAAGTKRYTFLANLSNGISGLYGVTDAAWKWEFDSSGSLVVGTVPWTSVSSRPTAVSSFTNDSGYITSSALSPYAPLSAPTFSGSVGFGSAANISSSSGNFTTSGTVAASGRLFGNGDTTKGLGKVNVTTTTGTPTGGSDGDFTLVY